MNQYVPFMGEITHMEKFIRDVDLMVLRFIQLGWSIREIAADIGKSIGTVQDILKVLEELGYVDNPYLLGEGRKARSRSVTDKGKQVLHDKGFRK
jgi:transposase